ncbi:MAG: ABC transporter substrate-binding protein [Gemmatimonadales bacterium]|nr:ABC transporter substrate-binding protein [Gemmatimonadales bacterium]
MRIAVVGAEGAIDGASLAAADINAAGGINGRPIELVAVPELSGSSARDAIATAERLADDRGILAVVGHSGSSRSLAASQVYNARRVPQVAPNTSTPLYTRAGAYSFRLVAGDAHQAEFIAGHLGTLEPRPRVALVYSNDDYGRALHGALRRTLKTRGVTLTYESPFVELESFAGRVNDVVAAIAASAPDVLIWAGRPQELALARASLASALPRLTVLGTDAVGRFHTSSNAAQRQGDMMVSYVDTESPDAAFKSVRTRFEALHGAQFVDLAALSYDAVGVLAAALRAGATSRESIVRHLAGDAMRADGYAGITGRITFDVNGDAPPRYTLFTLRNDSLIRVVP